MKTYFQGQFLVISLIILILVFGIIHRILSKLGKDSRTILPSNLSRRVRLPLLLLLFSILLRSNPFEFINRASVVDILHHLGILGIIAAITWMAILATQIAKEQILRRYDITQSDNLQARKVQTQYVILQNTIIFIIVVLAVGIALMTFDSIRAAGVSILTSAGIAGLIVGFAAQKAIGTVLAGIQIAITQPIRFDDVVIIESEFGRIEEITLTYVVVRVWDKRRMIVPTTFFIENTFENWTRTSADILGTVYLYLDYRIPIDAVRNELTKVLHQSDLWDGEVNALQVTDANDKIIELRALMSSGNSGDAFDLRVFVRERLILFIQKNYPDCLPQFRIRAMNENMKQMKEYEQQN